MALYTFGPLEQRSTSSFANEQHLGNFRKTSTLNSAMISNTGSLAVSWNEELKVVTGGGNKPAACTSSGVWCPLNLTLKFSFISSSAPFILTLHIPAVFHHVCLQPPFRLILLSFLLPEREEDEWAHPSCLQNAGTHPQQMESKQVHSITDCSRHTLWCVSTANSCPVMQWFHKIQ